MKILIDENMDVEFVELLPDHDTHHVIDEGWKAFSNGSLLSLADSESFDVFITADKNMPYQQSMKARGFSLIVLDVHPNNFANIAACVPDLLKMLGSCEPAKIYVINGPKSKSKR